MADKQFKFDISFTSHQIRAWKTLILMLDELGQEGLPMICNKRLNERDYGDLAGLNKDDARKKWGDEQVHIWRRSYDTQPPAAKVSKIRQNAPSPISTMTSCPGSWMVRMLSSLPTAIHCAPSS